MSILAQIPAFSIWETFYETIPALMSLKSSERKADQLAKIIKSGDIFNIFVYDTNPALSFDENKKIAKMYKSFTTWFLGRFFYLLSCKGLSKSHTIYVDIQICVLDQLSNTQLHIYEDIVREYSKAFNNLTKFVKSGSEKVVLECFRTEKDPELWSRLNLDHISVEISKTDYEFFLLSLLEIISFILSQNFGFNCNDTSSDRNLDDLIFLLAECKLIIKNAILKIFLKLEYKDSRDRHVLRKMDLFAHYFEQIVYSLYTKKIPYTEKDVAEFESLLVEFLKINVKTEFFVKLSEFLLRQLELNPSDKIRIFCVKNRNTPLYQMDEFNSFIKTSLENFDLASLCGLRNLILEDISKMRSLKEGVTTLKLCSFSAGKWKTFYFILLDSMQTQKCENCKVEKFLAFLNHLALIWIQIKLETKNHLNLIFVEENIFLLKMLSFLNRHFLDCDKKLDFRLLYELFLKLSFCFPTKVSTFFDLFSYIFTTKLNQHDFLGTTEFEEFKKESGEFCRNLVNIVDNQDSAFDYLSRFMEVISCGIFEFFQIREAEATFLQISRRLSEGNHSHMRILPHLFTLFKDSERLISQILQPILLSNDEEQLKEVASVFPQLICISSCSFTKVTQIQDDHLKITIFCDKCHANSQSEISISVSFAKLDLDQATLSSLILKKTLKFLTCSDKDLKIAALDVLPYCASHILKFCSENVAKIWVEKCVDSEKSVRIRFAKVAAQIIKHSQENAILADQVKCEIVSVLLAVLTKAAKKSLLETDVALQETVMETLHELAQIRWKEAELPTITNLIYFIMVPTSKYSFVAVNRFVEFAKINEMTPGMLYRLYRKEVCEIIAHLCIVNESLLDFSLSNSLSKISETLEFYSPKHFVSRECQHFLPFFIPRVVKAPSIRKLLDQMAEMVNLELPTLLANVYGNIFLHIFLKQANEDLKLCSTFLEDVTGLPSSHLRKKNLQVILNELLLNFHSKKDKILLGLKYLAKEDSDGKTVREYLQPSLLGLLQHFDSKLMQKNVRVKSDILLSLADFIQFMGPSYIGPVRYKIIALLQTAESDDFPVVKCEVWDAFVRSCEVESLAPQLATIFVSILPLIQSNPKKINEIFKYLIIQNESKTRDFIKDLFFVDDAKVDTVVIQTIRKYTQVWERYSLKEKMQNLVKYLNHETFEVRIRSLRRLRILMAQNREELDQMILGYNGIDPVIVELIEIVTLGCREKDKTLRIACGEVIGELGAVEPSHLPRRYAQNSRNFSFFINDDSFIINCLNELTKALQAEKNTVNMDKLSIAIQEILKKYKISSDENSLRHDLWKQFPKATQDLMVPLLTSKYIVKQSEEVCFTFPIYKSSNGATFHAWLYNWTQSLIATLPQENQTLLDSCLPAMKLNSRILMLFLPHILLHSIIHNYGNSKENMYQEMKAVISCFAKKRLLPEDSLSNDHKKSDLTMEKSDEIQCTKVIFIILDFLNRWIREWQWNYGSKGCTNSNYLEVKVFLGKYCKLELAKCNFHCGEYTRALIYLEDYITENSHEMSHHLPFLTQIYAQLDEPDGVAGVIALQLTEPPIEQRILSLEVSGKLSDATACYERLPQPLNLNHLKGLIQCYLELDNVNTALNVAQGALNDLPEFGNMLLEMQAEPLWRLSRYEDLDNLLKRQELADNSSWGVQIGRALLSFKNCQRNEFENLIQIMRSQQTDLLGAASVEERAYQQGYCYISRLHSLNELQQVEKATFEILSRKESVEQVLKNLVKEWDLRLKVVQESVRIVEPILCLRRAALERSKKLLETVPNATPLLNSLLGECWLKSAQTARAAGVHQQSFSYTIKAEEFALPSLFVEKSKLHWLREEHEAALTTLRRGLERLLPDNSYEAIAGLSLEKRKICGEAKLLIAKYNDSISNVDTDIKTANYKEAIEVYKEWEVGFVNVAQFFDRRFQAFPDEERDSRGSDLQVWMITYFCKSLKYGTVYVYQSLPRLLSIWFDYGTRLLEVTNSQTREERKKNLIKMTRLIDYALESLPTYIFLTAFSQIISRICHPQKEVYIELKSIIIKILLHYPQQSLWMIISVIKSSYEMRAKRCAEIFCDPKMRTASMTKLVKDFTILAEKLIELCNKDISQDTETAKVSTLLRSLPRMLTKNDFSQIMIPTHQFRKLVLPNPDFASGEHNPFPNHYVHIVGIDDEITILRSLQRPRKITFRGSDGKGYIQMLKPKDDLRKDFRLMEFNDIVNHLLSRESESRQKRLNIRLYSVSPLNEECGLIEWIPNLVGLRPILVSIMKQKSIGMTVKEIRDASCNIRDPLARKREIFTKILLAKHPPVLGEWFRRTFPDAQSWFFARTAYIRTTAVISMVGYILGLGDRHGENILFDSICGDTVHVDFNCLFNKGESFEWPERVPFRLTQNMVAAMGPLGVEGVFRKSCACTLQVLRNNADTLMSIVTPFVYDPLVSWPRNNLNIKSSAAEKTNEQAVEHIKNIKSRLQGVITKSKDKSSIPLSVDGQTNSLINEAINVDNLCQMYIGWGPYL